MALRRSGHQFACTCICVVGEVGVDPEAVMVQLDPEMGGGGVE